MNNEELNKLVAEKVMEWKVESEVIFDEEIRLPFTKRWWVDKDGNYANQYHFVPSERIEDAWKVAEALRKLGEFNIGNDSSEWISEMCTFNDGGIDKYFEVTNESAPMSICLVALKFKGIDI